MLLFYKDNAINTEYSFLMEGITSIPLMSIYLSIYICIDICKHLSFYLFFYLSIAFQQTSLIIILADDIMQLFSQKIDLNHQELF